MGRKNKEVLCSMTNKGRPAGKHYLTEEQSQLASDNIGLVWWFMKRVVKKGVINGDELDEASGYVIWHFCMACESYDPTKGIKLSSYATSAFWSGISRYKYLKKINDRYLKIGLGSGSNDYDNNRAEFQDYKKIESSGVQFSHLSGNNIEWDDIKSLFDDIKLTSVEEKIMYFHIRENKTFKQIGKIFNHTGQWASMIYRKIILRLKVYVKMNNLVFEDYLPEGVK